MSKKQCRWAKADRKPTRRGDSSMSPLLDNWPDTGLGASRAPKGALTWTGELVKQRGLEPLEPKGKLDT
jgi:hypothetical protein